MHDRTYTTGFFRTTFSFAENDLFDYNVYASHALVGRVAIRFGAIQAKTPGEATWQIFDTVEEAAVWLFNNFNWQETDNG